MPIIRTRAEIDTLLDGPKPAEEKLLAACEAGEICVVGDGKLPPEDAGPTREIRADVLRYLILGGCENCRVQGQGVRVLGAHVTGALDISFQTARGVTLLMNTRFDSGIEAMQENLAGLNLTGSQIPTLNMQGAEVKGNVFLNKINSTGEISLSDATVDGQLLCNDATFSSESGVALLAERAEVKGGVFFRGLNTSGEIRLSGAIVGGQLDCEGATFSNESGFALNAQGAEVKGGVFLREVTATGEIRLSGAIIGGQLDCEGATFSNESGFALNAQGAEVKGGVFLREVTATGEIRLSGAIIGGQLACEGATFSNEGGFALNADTTTISGGLFWKDKVTCQAGTVNFTAATILNLSDDLSCWPDDGRLRLNGLTYDRIYGNLDVAARLRWVKGGSYLGDTFTPQPYTQLAKVYRTMGRDGDARRVLRARERLEHEDRQRRWCDVPDGLWKVGFNYLGRQWSEPLLRLWSHFLRATIGYGFAPYRALWSLGGIWLLATFLACQAWTDGDFAPNSDVIQTSAAWTALAGGPNPAETWNNAAPGRDWETFNRYAYAADLVIPIIDLNQTDAWTPSTNRGPWGQRLWRYGFLLNIAGWFITALAAAAITGLIQRGRD